MLYFRSISIRKVGLLAYLFFVANNYNSKAQDVDDTIDSTFLVSYRNAYNLNFAAAREPFTEPSSTPFAIYFDHLEEAINLFIQENENLYDQFKENTDERISAIKRSDDYPRYLGFFLSEIRLHESILDLKFGREFYSAINFNKAHRNIEKNLNEYPEFELQYKTSGLIDVVTGSAPDNYNWLVSLFGFSKDIQSGLEKLEIAANAGKIIDQEVLLLQTATQVFLLDGSSSDQQLKLPTDSMPVTFEYISSFLKSKNGDGSGSNQQMEVILDSYPGVSVKLPHVNYMVGINQLQRGDYNKSKSSFLRFLKDFSGFNLIKDTYYRLSIACQITGEQDSSLFYLRKIPEVGNTFTDSDRYADRVARKGKLPSVYVTQLRLSTDGGYYSRAFAIIEEFDKEFDTDHPDKAEWEYRKARLFHENGNIDRSIELYRAVIDQDISSSTNYFAPNSALQLGYIYLSKKNYDSARKYFEKVFDYKKYPYESSIKNKAKNALKSIPQ